MSDPLWLTEARRNMWVREIPGAPTAPAIAKWLMGLHAWWQGDETPWCGTFAAHCMQYAAIKLPTAWYRAKGWLDWGQKLDQPTVGCVVVFGREGGGHVGFVVGKSKEGKLVVLGGNQGDCVRLSTFDMSRVLGYRWPAEDKLPPLATLPILNAEQSRGEA